jgi:hypothetical protein
MTPKENPLEKMIEELDKELYEYWKQFYISKDVWTAILLSEGYEIPFDTGEFWLKVKLYQESKADCLKKFFIKSLKASRKKAYCPRCICQNCESLHNPNHNA